MAVSYTFLQTGEFQALVDRVTALENNQVPSDVGDRLTTLEDEQDAQGVRLNALETAPSEVNYIQFADYDPEVALPHETMNVIVGTIDELKTLLPSETLPGDTLVHTVTVGWDPAQT